MNKKRASVNIPEELTSHNKAWKTIYIDTSELDLWKATEGVATLVSEAVREAMHKLHKPPIKGQGLNKIHIGEPKCSTRMRGEYTIGGTKFLKEKGVSGVVSGDTTVAYTGKRGHKENPMDNCDTYVNLARKHGWCISGSAGTPFVVLDRPATSKKGEFEFDESDYHVEIEGINKFNDFYVAGGFAKSDFTVNNAHLTLHGLAGVAGCVKSIAMGCTSLPGKLRMHQSLLPYFDADRCIKCGRCVDNCPEDALTLSDDKPTPAVDVNKCIGCGECEAVCAVTKQAVHLKGEDITDWSRGEDTLPVRMADYMIGMLSASDAAVETKNQTNKWDSTIHLMHMYAITERCDCIDVTQKPLIRKDLGFLIGKNPFAIDKLAAELLIKAMNEQSVKIDDEQLLQTAHKSADYVKKTYNILDEVPVEKTVLS
jgi:hypothetical protein